MFLLKPLSGNKAEKGSLPKTPPSKTPPPLLANRHEPRQVDFQRYRPLQQTHGQNHSMITLEIDQDALKSAEGPAGHANPLTHFDIRPRLMRRPGGNRHLDCGNLFLCDRQGSPAVSNDLLYSRRHANRSPILKLTPTKQTTLYN